MQFEEDNKKILYHLKHPIELLRQQSIINLIIIIMGFSILCFLYIDFQEQLSIQSSLNVPNESKVRNKVPENVKPLEPSASESQIVEYREESSELINDKLTEATRNLKMLNLDISKNGWSFDLISYFFSRNPNFLALYIQEQKSDGSIQIVKSVLSPQFNEYVSFDEFIRKNNELLSLPLSAYNDIFIKEFMISEMKHSHTIAIPIQISSSRKSMATLVAILSVIPKLNATPNPKSILKNTSIPLPKESIMRAPRNIVISQNMFFILVLFTLLTTFIGTRIRRKKKQKDTVEQSSQTKITTAIMENSVSIILIEGKWHYNINDHLIDVMNITEVSQYMAEILACNNQIPLLCTPDTETTKSEVVEDIKKHSILRRH